ncbi:MAG: lysophospholipid acyltransferase family protein [Rhodobacterales bacterium]|nr:lysophospholipid acyltransferase family protein [Rhodobacterales bacterium]MDX5391961.1 lysophospholipid acyltransferase family protein [Rhodobacterales bacterium]MDX5491652.1 lysophospholipid acyltransferase family protein [Rhodobacterales bacterium]
MASDNQERFRDLAARMSDLVPYVVFLAFVGALNLLPYGLRVRLGGFVFARLVAPLAGYRRRIEDNLRLIFPAMSEAQRADVTAATSRNIGRMAMELLSPKGLRQRALAAPVSGPGWDAMQEAKAENRPIILVSGHFGNYDVIRAGTIAHGFRVGGIYRALNNPYFNRYYLRNISTIGTPLFERGRRGLGEMVRFLRGGGTVAMLIDQHMHKGEPLDFMGQTAMTALSAAEMALKYDALLVPCYGIRRDDGLSFDAVFEAPIPHTNAVEMTQALNDSLQARIEQNIDQWFWIHRRWKGGAPHG